MVNNVSVGFCADDKSLLSSLKGVDVAVFGFNVFGSVNFKSELSGKSEVLAEMGRISAKLDAVCFFGVKTDSYGLKRNSIIACSKGRLLGICDETLVSSGNSASCGYKIYNTAKGKIGVLVGNDICNVCAVKSLTDCECDLIIDISEAFFNFKADVLCGALSFLNGVAICFLAGEKCVGTSASGDVAAFTESSVGKINLITKRKYNEYVIKRRGS